MKLIKTLTKYFLFILSISCIFVLSYKIDLKAAEYQPPVQEFRAVWVSHFAGDLSRYQNEEQYKTQYLKILDNVEAMGINAIIFHIRTHNDAFYPSKLNPVSSYYSQVNFDEFDPLEWMIAETHKRGIEFHAWLNPYRVSSTGVSDIDSLLAKYNDVNPASNKDNLLITGEGVILNPGLPHVRDFITDTCMEIVENYDVDAIHFDDYFYISGCDDTTTREQYNTENLSMADFRRKQVDLFIEQLSNELRAFNLEHNRTVQLGISPSGIYRNGGAYDRNDATYNENGDLTYPLNSNTSGFAHYGDYLYSDTKKWIDEEWIDYILPQSYWAMGHNGANFNRLTDWWSLVVEHKDVNLYMGIGIYMVLSTGTSANYWKSPNEIKNQLMDMNKYENISGMSFYKYASLISSNSLIQGHVKTLKEHWTKKIPCAVIPSYTYLDEPLVSNINISNDILTFDKVENVRGYMVWQVPSNEFVDINSIDQLYCYTQDNEIEIESGYDYYVSTVNLANEISEPIGNNKEKTYQDVIQLINNISFPITKNNSSNISYLKTIYDKLSDLDQSRVTNYYILEAALSQVDIINNIYNDIDAFIGTLKSDTLVTYKLPQVFKDYEVSWEYNNPDDANIYDLLSGRILKRNLSTTNISLNLTLTKQNISVSKEYKLNVGYVKQNEIGMFYRNTPNSLNKEEDTGANASYIGWSGKVMKFGNKVFFIADGNYIELTSNSIPNTQWHSCANVYVNKTNNNITATVEEFDILTSSNYGYFIIGADGYVRESVATASGNVTLRPNETIFIPKYLDSQIDGSYMKPASNLAVNTKVDIISPVYNDDYINEIIIQINNLPDNISLEHKNVIYDLIELVETLPQNEKDLITNLSELLEKKEIIDKILKENIDNESKVIEAINTIASYISDISLYSDESVLKINSIISQFEAIITFVSSDEIDDFIEQYKLLLDEIKTIKEEEYEVLLIKIEDAKVEIASYIKNLNLYYEEQINEINAKIKEHQAIFETATTQSELTILVNTAKSELRNIPVKLVFERRQVINKLNELLENYDFSKCTESEVEEVKTLVSKTKTNVNNSLSVDAVKEVFESFNLELKVLQTAHLNRYKESKIAEATDYINEIEVGNNSLSTLLSEFINTIAAANTYEEIDSCYSQFKVDVHELMNPENPDSGNEQTGLGCAFGSFTMISLFVASGFILLLKKKNH